MNAVETAFDFVTVSYLTRIGNQSAGTLTELLTGLEHCSDASIFHHTFQTLGSHHFLTEGFSNDFAQWVFADTNRNDLAEQLAALDIRDYVSIAALRRDLCRLVGEFCTAFPHFAGQSALERFYFHFISSRLRLQLQTNDFSYWLAGGLGLASLAENINHIDIYTNTLDSTRAKLLRLIDRERRKA